MWIYKQSVKSEWFKAILISKFIFAEVIKEFPNWLILLVISFLDLSRINKRRQTPHGSSPCHAIDFVFIEEMMIFCRYQLSRKMHTNQCGKSELIKDFFPFLFDSSLTNNYEMECRLYYHHPCCNTPSVRRSSYVSRWSHVSTTLSKNQKFHVQF